MSRRSIVFYGILLMAAGTMLGVQLGGTLFEPDVTRALRRVEDAFITIARRYVDDVDPDDLAADAIEGMLDALDPHSAYLDARRTAVETEQFNAEFEGIGIAYGFIEGTDGADTLSVVEVLPGGPSELVGLVTGDRIVAIDDSTAIGILTPDVHRRLKGPRGTVVRISIKRPGYDGLIDVDIRRDRVPIVTLDAAWLMDDGTGIIRLNRFARSTHAEVREALGALIDAGMERLVLDLRGNPGGLMDQAVRVAGEFLRRGDLIVSQRGRAEGTTESFRSRGRGLWTDGPLIILVDPGSASASEIVAGAIQDHDRGLVAGRRSFGKGLVQNQIVLEDGSAMRLTVARFYTPSGRLIQTGYDNGDREGYYEEKYARLRSERLIPTKDLMGEAPDSLVYTTVAGRTVLAGGGIVPDYIVVDDTLAGTIRAVLVRGLEQEFVRTWLDRDGEDLRRRFETVQAFIDGFEVTRADLDRFRAFAATRGVHVGDAPPGPAGGEVWIAPEEFAASRNELTLLLKGRMARRLFDRSAWYRVFAPADGTLQQALSLWDEAERVHALYRER